MWRFVLISLCLVACGDDSNDSNGGSFNGLLGGSTTNERAGPMSVAGSQWTTGPIDFDGFIMEAVFEFSDTEIVFSNICEGSTTVSVRSPLKYTYSLDVLEGSYSETVDGDASCYVNIDPFTLAFEQDGPDLILMLDGGAVRLEGTAGNQGLYGQWTFEEDGNRLIWWMGNGTLAARAECENGLSAETQTPARYANFFSIQSSASAGDEYCNVSLDPADIQYRIEGNTLVMTSGTEDIRLTRR